MLEKSPDDRPDDCSEIVETLTEFLTARPDNVMAKQLGELMVETFPEELGGRERSTGASGQGHIRIDAKSNPLTNP